MISEFEPVHLRNTAWASATLLFRDMPLLDAIASSSLKRIDELYDQQHIANLAWAFAKLKILNVPLMNALAAAASTIISDFGPQGLSNMSWAYSRLCLGDPPLLHSLSAEALRKLGDLGVQDLANMAWSFANIRFESEPFMQALSAAAIAPGAAPSDSATVHSVLWAMWKLRKSDLMRGVFENWSSHGQVPCILELGLLAMESEWQKRWDKEPQLLSMLMSNMPVRMMRLALWKIAMVPEAARPAEAPTAPTDDVLGLTAQECHRYYKLGRFVQYLEMTERGGSPDSVIEAVEQFPNDLGRYLKVAGGDKAVAIWDAFLRRRPASHEIAVEFGTLVGYTAVRLGAASRRDPPAGARGSRVVTMEVDVCHAAIARHVVDLAGLSGTVEVWTGQVRDLLPRLTEEFGCSSLGFVFMDQKGAAFHEDLTALEDAGMLGVAACVVAGNCLRSGASFFVWHVSNTSKYSASIWRIPEFVQDDVEDWLAVCEFQGPSSAQPGGYPPEVEACLSQLAWEADTTARAATAEDGSLHVDDFVAFSQYMSRYFEALGIEAVPWPGLIEPPDELAQGMPLNNHQLLERYEEATRAAEAALELESSST